MTAADFAVAALLVSRLCHDLAAPAEAVHNGIKILRDPDSPDWFRYFGRE